MNHIRQWWRQPDRHEWLSEYLASRRLLRVSSVVMAAIMTALPAARAAATPPVGMATGKFQGEATTVTIVESNDGLLAGEEVFTDAERLPPFGRWLRSTSLDELPELWNILRGDMSFVGPRPPLREYVERFPRRYSEVLRTRPGVTGLATLIYHAHEDRLLADCHTAEATEAVYYRRCLPTKLRLDRIYQQRRSVALDLWIIANTMMTVIIPGWVRRR